MKENKTSIDIKTIESTQIESVVVGSIIIDSNALDIVLSSNITIDDFYISNNQIIFNACKELKKESINIDLVILSEYLKKYDLLENIGGYNYLIDLSESVPTTANIEYYINILKELSQRRKLLNLSFEIKNSSLNPNKDNDYSLFTDKLDKILSMTNKTIKKSFKDSLNKEIERYLDIADHSIINDSIKTDYNALDNLLFASGLSKGDLIVIAGRPSMGKTSFMLGITLNILKQDKAVYIQSLEMSIEQLTKKILILESEINITKLEAGVCSNIELKTIIEKKQELEKLKLVINDDNLSLIEIQRECRKLKKEKSLDLIIIDYLQMIDSNQDYFNNRNIEIGKFTRKLKLLAKELEVPVILLSQLSRNVEQRQNKRPVLSDLRDSGNIEQDADVIMFLYRDDYYDKQSKDSGVAEVIISKNRMGRTGIAKLGFESKYAKFYNLENFR